MIILMTVLSIIQTKETKKKTKKEVAICAEIIFACAFKKVDIMYGKMKNFLTEELNKIEKDGLYKKERIITTTQDAVIKVSTGEEVINFCANNYLGLSSHPKVIEAAHSTLDSHGFGMSSVRFICGTQDIHKELEEKVANFLGTEDTILYAAAFDANGGIFEPLLTAEDAIISDALNHASIIDGVRLCKAARYRYANNDMADLEERLKEASAARFKIIVTDGVFSMDGYVAQLDKICDLADKYDALVMVDECHATGFIGKTGRGSIELRNVIGRVDIITGTFGKALGGAMGDSLLDGEKLSNCFANDHAHISSLTLWPQILSALPSLFWTCSAILLNCEINWKIMFAILRTVFVVLDLTLRMVIVPLCPLCFMMPRSLKNLQTNY